MQYETPLGRYIYRHIAPSAFFGYGQVRVLPDQQALVGDAAKTLLDLVYLTPGGESSEHLRSLRLDGLGTIPRQTLCDHADRWGKPKISRAVAHILEMPDAPAEDVQS